MDNKTTHYFTDNRNLKSDRKEHSFRFSGFQFSFVTDHGVFSLDGVDEGTRILLDTLQDIPLSGKILDLGCGYGVIGIALKKTHPDVNVMMSDVNPRAAGLAEENAARNDVDVSTVVSDGFADIHEMFDAVVTNPPIRAGKQVIYAMFADARTHLNRGGKLLAVIRRKQGAESAVKELQSVFGNCTVMNREKGFWILQSEN